MSLAGNSNAALKSVGVRSRSGFDALLQVNPDEWAREVPEIRAFLDRFGERLPVELRTSLDRLSSRLKVTA